MDHGLRQSTDINSVYLKISSISINTTNKLRSLSRHHHHHLRNIQRHGSAASLIVASAATYVFFTAIVDYNNSVETIESTKQLHENRAFTYSIGQRLSRCESNQHAKMGPLLSNPTSCKPKPLSRLTQMAYRWKLYPHSFLPLPRLLTPHDPLFSYPELRRGLVVRIEDEKKLKNILSSHELMEARKNQDHRKMQHILQQMNAVAYGENISPQMREDFLIQYGCTGYTEEIINYLLHNFASRGIIEVGAGNGQWARVLNDLYNKQTRENGNAITSTPYKSMREFVLAYDNFEQLPLSPMIYHKNTLPATKYFYSKVQKLSHVEAVRESRGRVLLLVYPPPGSMAIETVREYLDTSCAHYGGVQNDTVVYVGEGRGGANADDAFFDFFLSCNKNRKKDDEDDGGHEQECWVIEQVMNVHASPGGKGYEKLFVFRRSVG